MAISYKSGRSRTLKLVLDVTVGGSFTVGPFGGSSAGQTLGTGSSYTTVSVATPSNDQGFKGFSSGLGVFVALGQKGSTITSDLNIAVGVVVPRLSGNGFVPLYLVTAGSTTTFTVGTTIVRTLALEERFDHTSNGKRWDVYGSAGSCTETYTVHGPSGDVTITSGGSTTFVPGQTAGWQAFGIDAPTIGGRGFVAYSKSGGAAAQVTWSGNFVDSHGDPLFGDPSVPSASGTGGATSWGSVSSVVPTTGGITANIAQAVVQWMPTHAFNVKTEPRCLPSGSLVTQHHRVEYELVSPIGGAGSAGGYTLSSTGETITFTCGGAKWSASLTGEGGYTSNADAFLPVLSRVKVTHADASRHYYCQVRTPFNAIGLTQAQSLTIPSTSSVSIASGSSTSVTPGAWLGYRWLRVTASSTGTTGTLTVAIRLNGSSSAVVTKALTTTSAGTPQTIEIDLLSTPGAITAEALTLDRITFSASGAAFVVASVEAFIKTESVVVCCSRRRADFSGPTGTLPGPEATPWIKGYTDGVLSLQAPTFDGNNPVGWWSQSVRQLVQEINGDALHSYGSWSSAEPLTFVQASGSPPAPSSLTGWSASLSSPPAGGKGYSSSETYENAEWIDGDVYVSALHGDGLIGGATLVGGALT